MPMGHSLSISTHFLSKKRTLMYISREKGDHYYIETRHNDLFFPLQSFSRKTFKVARYSFSGPIPPKFEHKLRCHKQSFGKIDTTVVLDKDENLN